MHNIKFPCSFKEGAASLIFLVAKNSCNGWLAPVFVLVYHTRKKAGPRGYPSYSLFSHTLTNILPRAT